MVVSSRTFVAVSIGLVGLGLLVGPSLGQQQDGAVRKTNGQGAKPAPPTPPTVGTIDMGEVFKGYDKVKASAAEFKTAVMKRQGELMQVMTQMKAESEELAKLRVGSEDYKKHESKITDLKVKSEAGRETAEREFALREAEMMATLYKEIQSMVARVATHRGMTYILRVANDPVVGTDPNSAMRAIERSVVYADPKNDITKDVINYLNYEYKAAGGVVPPAATTPTSGAGAAAVRPTGN